MTADTDGLVQSVTPASDAACPRGRWSARVPESAGVRACATGHSAVSGRMAKLNVDGAPASGSVVNASLSRALRAASYGVTLPERLVRSMAAGLGGAVRETADRALPGVLKRTTIYSIMLDRALRFIIEDVGQVEGVYEAAEDEDAYLVRKMVGNFVEMAGLITLRTSPLWILAVTGDAAFGLRTYLDLLVDELKARGILEPTETVASAGALLERLERLSAAGALAIDLPPTEIAQLKEMARGARDEAQGVVQDAARFVTQAERLLNPLRVVARAEGVSVFDLSALLSMRAARALSGAALRSAPVGLAAAGAGRRLVSDEILAHYAQSLEEVRERGFYTTLRQSYGPYIGAAMRHFHADRSTLTGRLISGELLRDLWRRCRRSPDPE